MAQTKGDVRPIFDVHDAMGPAQLVFVAGRSDFLVQYPEVMQDFFEDYLRFWCWMLAPANRQAAIELATHFTKRPASAYADWLLTSNDYYRDPDGLVDVVMLQRNVDTLYDMQFISKPLEISQHLDLS